MAMTESVAMQRNKIKQERKKGFVLAMLLGIPVMVAAWVALPIWMWVSLPESAPDVQAWQIKLPIVLTWIVVTVAAVKALYWPSRSQTANIDSIQSVLQKHYGGVYKRIDENRELLELIQQKYPSLLKENSWVESLLQSQDGFLNDLATSVPADAKLPRFNLIEGKFPRPWPGKQ